MKSIVIGLGSMGKRRIRLIQELDKNIQIIGVDSNPERLREAEERFHIICMETLSRALEEDADCAFVCTSPLSHAAIIRELLQNNLHTFTEINLVSDDYDRLINLAASRQRVLFLSSTFLYRRDIGQIISRVGKQRVNYLYHTGQYLPDWHPWESYQDFFVADIRTNGCREIMAIEFPWIIKCFGSIKNVHVAKGNMSTLRLGYCDSYQLLIEHETGNSGMIAVDVVARKAQRSLEIYGEELQLFWNGTPDSLRQYNIGRKTLEKIETYEKIDKDVNYCDNIIENAYMEEIAAFFYQLATQRQDRTLYSFEKDLETLRWLDRIENEEI